MPWFTKPPQALISHRPMATGQLIESIRKFTSSHLMTTLITSHSLLQGKHCKLLKVNETIELRVFTTRN